MNKKIINLFFLIMSIFILNSCSNQPSPEDTLYEQLQQEQMTVEKLQKENYELDFSLREKELSYETEITKLNNKISTLEDEIKNYKDKIYVKGEKTSISEQILKAEIDGLKREKASLEFQFEDLKKHLAEKEIFINEEILLQTGKKLYSKCVSCHGANGEKSALGVTQPIYEWSKDSIYKALIKYQDVSFASSKNNIMRKQVLGLSEKEIKSLSEYISTFKKPIEIKPIDQNISSKPTTFSENPIKEFLTSKLKVLTHQSDDPVNDKLGEKRVSDFLKNSPEISNIPIKAERKKILNSNIEEVEFKSPVLTDSLELKTLSADGSIVGDQNTLELKPIEIKENKRISPSLNQVQIGARLYSKCITCHGVNGEKRALGKSKTITGWTQLQVIRALNGYIDGTYGGSMSAIMKGQVASLTEDDILHLAKYISTLKAE